MLPDQLDSINERISRFLLLTNLQRQVLETFFHIRFHRQDVYALPPIQADPAYDIFTLAVE